MAKMANSNPKVIVFIVNKDIVAGNCTGATFRVNLDICLEGRTNAIKYSGLLALTKRLSTNKQRTRPVRVQSSFLVFLCNLNKTVLICRSATIKEELMSRNQVTSFSILDIVVRMRSVAQAVVNRYLGQFLIERSDWSKG
jgi:hypothetical protein